MPYRALLVVMLFLASSIVSAKPNIELTEALRLAQAHVSEKNNPNDDRYLESVAWHEDYSHPEKSCWIVFWAPNKMAFDDQLVVWIFNDGSIRHQDGLG